MKKWKVAIVGTGYWSDKHLQAWMRLEKVEIAALCDRDFNKMRKKAEEYGIPVENLYTNIEEMVEKVEFEVIDIITTPDTHKELVTIAAQAGKQIMCQKPFANTLEEAKEMVQIVKEHGVRLMVTEDWRWLEPFQLMKSELESGEIGRIHAVRYIHTDWYSPRFKYDSVIPQPFFRDMPKFLFFEMGVHWYDAWRFLFGNPSRLYAETGRISPFIVGEDTGIVTLGHDDFYGFMDMSWATRQLLLTKKDNEVWLDLLEQMVIEGEKSTLKLYANGNVTRIDDDGNETMIREHTKIDFYEAHFLLNSHFIECLENGEEFQTSGEDNLETLEIVFATYESATNHQSVTFSWKDRVLAPNEDSNTIVQK